MDEEIKKTSAEWGKESDYKVLDPDGWDRANYDYSFNKELVTKVEFERRLFRSTITLNYPRLPSK